MSWIFQNTKTQTKYTRWTSTSHFWIISSTELYVYMHTRNILPSTTYHIDLALAIASPFLLEPAPIWVFPASSRNLGLIGGEIQLLVLDLRSSSSPLFLQMPVKTRVSSYPSCIQCYVGTWIIKYNTCVHWTLDKYIYIFICVYLKTNVCIFVNIHQFLICVVHRIHIDMYSCTSHKLS